MCRCPDSSGAACPASTPHPAPPPLRPHPTHGGSVPLFPPSNSCVNPPPPPHYSIHLTPRHRAAPLRAELSQLLTWGQAGVSAGRGQWGPPALSAAEEGGGAGEAAQRRVEEREEAGHLHHASLPPPRLGDPPPAARKEAGRVREGRRRGEKGREKRERPRREERAQRRAPLSAAPTLTDSRGSKPASVGGGMSAPPIGARRRSLLPAAHQ